MAIFPNSDEYIDHGGYLSQNIAGGLTYFEASILAMGDGRIITNTGWAEGEYSGNVLQYSGAESSVITLSESGYTRGTFQPGVGHQTGAWAPTLDGNVLTQSTTSYYQTSYGHNELYTVLHIADDGTITVPNFGDNQAPVPDNYGYFPFYGISDSRNDSICRLPGNNNFIAWRRESNVGAVNLDFVRVADEVPEIREMLNVWANLSGLYSMPSIPRQIITISSTEAITCVFLPSENVLRMVHATFDGTTASMLTQDVGGYAYTEDCTLLPSTTYDAEIIVKYSTTDNRQVRRFGVTWTGTGFQFAAMPWTQLTPGLKPPAYSPRSASAHVAIDRGASYLATSNAIYIARQYIDDGSDDNFVLLTEHNTEDGTIVAQSWLKGGQSGATDDQLFITAINMAYDQTTHQLVLGINESYFDTSLSTPLNYTHTRQSNRFAAIGARQDLGESLRSQRASFAP